MVVVLVVLLELEDELVDELELELLELELELVDELELLELELEDDEPSVPPQNSIACMEP